MERKRKERSISTDSKEKCGKMFKVKLQKKESDSESENDTEAYENLRLKNIEEKRKMLESMNFEQMKEDIFQMSKKPKKKFIQYGIKNTGLKKIILEPRPKSLRLQGKNPDLTDTHKVVNTFEYDSENNFAIPSGPLEFEAALRDGDNEQLSKDFLSLLKSANYDQKIKEDWYNTGLSIVKKKLNSLKLQENHVAKVVPHRIFSLQVHPFINKLLVFAGDKRGHLGMWDVHAKNAQDGVYVYRPHSFPINCLRIPQENPHHLYSLGYDQTIRQADLTRAVFEEVFRIPDDNPYSCSYFDFLSPNSAVISLTKGLVAITDFRDKSVTNYEISVARRPLKTVSVHPTKQHYFITSGTEGIITLWDSRNMKIRNGKPITSLSGFRTTSSAFFSPVTGNKILATSHDDKIRVFNSSTLDDTISLTSSIKHNNQTGRWLTTFKAAWLPNCEDLFIVGSMERPRRIEVLSESGQAFHLFSSDHLASVCSINSIHPSYNAIAGGNSSGRIHLFM